MQWWLPHDNNYIDAECKEVSMAARKSSFQESSWGK